MKMAEYKMVDGKLAVIHRDLTSDELDMRNEEVESEPSIEEQLADLSELVGILTEVICNG